MTFRVKLLYLFKKKMDRTENIFSAGVWQYHIKDLVLPIKSDKKMIFYHQSLFNQAIQLKLFQTQFLFLIWKIPVRRLKLEIR
jgi:hypothetical protein